jgi:hypothetical protein
MTDVLPASKLYCQHKIVSKVITYRYHSIVVVYRTVTDLQAENRQRAEMMRGGGVRLRRNVIHLAENRIGRDRAALTGFLEQGVLHERPLLIVNDGVVRYAVIVDT